MEVQAVWRVLQALWNQDYKVHPLNPYFAHHVARCRTAPPSPADISAHYHPQRAVMYCTNAQPSPDTPKRRVTPTSSGEDC